MNVLAVVPARGGSKGVPRKNLRVLAGRSLVAWAVAAGREAQLVSDVVVSSDDPEILLEGARAGATPLVRPAELATDTASTDAVLVHAAAAAGWQHDLVVLLQPTVPVRAPGLVDLCIRRLLDARADSAFTGYPLHFVWRRDVPGRWRRNGDPPHVTGEPTWVQCNSRGKRIPRQAFVPTDLRWHEDGAIYVTRADLLRRLGARIGGRIEVVPNRRTVDIDGEADLAVAEALLRYGVDRNPLTPHDVGVQT